MTDALCERENIAFFELAIICTVLLDGIVCQMHKQVVLLSHIVLLSRHPYVTLLEVIAFVLRSD